MKKYIVLIAIGFSSLAFSQNNREILLGTYKTYYVSLTGNNSNSGLSEGAAWRTLTYAAGSTSPVIAGDKIYIKAGDYGNENIVLAKSGVKGAVISFIGYKTVPGDSPPLLVSRSISAAFNAWTSTDMPTYNGTSRNSGTWIDLNTQRYIEIKNLQATAYQRGLTGGIQGATNTTASTTRNEWYLYNLGMMTLGNTADAYDGIGVGLGSLEGGSVGAKRANGNRISHCVVVNAGAECFNIIGDFNHSTFNKAYCNENTNANTPTDYFYNITGNYNITENCYLHMDASMAPGSHGFETKTNAEWIIDVGVTDQPILNCTYNQFLFCSTFNMGSSFSVRHRGSQYNRFYKNRAVGKHTGALGNNGGGEGDAITIRDGASNNTFEACSGDSLYAGIVFADTSEDGGATSHPGTGNKIFNCIIRNMYFAIYIPDAGVTTDAGANEISNTTWYKNKYHFYADQRAQNMVYKNNIYDGAGATEGAWRAGTYATDFAAAQFSNNTFFNITGGMPGGFVAATTAGITTDPLFVSATDLHLQASSPARDAGLSLSYISKDYDRMTKPATNCSQGAYEK